MEKQYLELIDKILKDGIKSDDRTGVGTISIPHAMLSHDMSEGFPITTTKRIGWKTVKVELEGFLKGITNKSWYQERGCTIWDEWCNPSLIPSWLNEVGYEKERKEFQLNENRLGLIYGAQWRNFNGVGIRDGVDQIEKLLHTLKTNPTDRRMLVSAWNPNQLGQMALPPCHYSWQVSVLGGKLHLNFVMRSLDVGLGWSYNAAFYGLLLEILARYAGLQPGTLTAFLTNVHIYSNHVEPLKQQLSRTPYKLPKLLLEDSDVVNWNHGLAKLEGYVYHPSIKMDVAV